MGDAVEAQQIEGEATRQGEEAGVAPDAAGILAQGHIADIIAYSSPFGHRFQSDSATRSSGDSAAGAGRFGRTDGARRRGRIILKRAVASCG